MEQQKTPLVGIAVIMLRDRKVLLGKRKSPLGKGTWSFPGGKLEMNESIENCARREVIEETGISIDKPKFATITNDVFIEEKMHYVTIYLICTEAFGEANVMEPEKCYEWKWFLWNELPEPLFLPVQNLLKQKFNPYDAVK